MYYCYSIPAVCAENDVQLVAGRTEYEGRVEFCEGGQWKTICDEEWGDEEARVVCRQKAFPTYGMHAKKTDRSRKLIW